MAATRLLAATLLAGISVQAGAQIVACAGPDQAKTRHMAESDSEALAVIGRPNAAGDISTERLRQGRRLLGVPFINLATGYHVDRSGGAAHLVVHTTDGEPLRSVTLYPPGGQRTLTDPVAISRQRCDSNQGAIVVTTCHTLTTSAFRLPEELLRAMSDDPRPTTTITLDGIGSTHCAIGAYPREFRLLRQAVGIRKE